MSKGLHVERGITKRGEDGLDDGALNYLTNAQETILRQPKTLVGKNTLGRFQRIAELIGKNFLTEEEKS